MKSSGEQPTRNVERDRRDRELFSRFVAGDEGGFTKLYSFYEKSLIVYCQYLLPTPQDAQEVFQETWLRIVQVRKRGETVEHFRALLFTIARNTALKHLSGMKHTNKQVSLSTLDPENDWLLKSHQGFSEIEELVNRALKRLPLLQREAFMLHAIFGYTFHEIAEMQGVSMSAAKTRAFRARSYMRKLLASWLGMAENEDPLSDVPPQSVLHSHSNN